MRDSFIFYRSYVEALKELPDENRLHIMDAVLQYALEGDEPNLSGVEKAVFLLMRPQIDANNRRYENGKKGGESGVNGGRPSKNKPQENPTETPKKPLTNPEITPNKPQENPTETPNENENVNVNENDIYSLSHSPAPTREEADEVARDYLNFMREHTNVQNDLTNPSEIASIDFSLLSQKIAESKYLQTRHSISWLIWNYQKIISDEYKDFPKRTKSPPGDPQLEYLKELYEEAKQEDARNAEGNGS